MKKIQMLLKNNRKIVIGCLIFALIYWIGTWNFSIIKVSPFFSTALYERESGTWICKEHNLIAVNSSDEPYTMIVTDQNSGTKYKMSAFTDYFIELFYYNQPEERIWSSGMYNYKRWGKVYKFELMGPDDNEWNDGSLTFKKIR